MTAEKLTDKNGNGISIEEAEEVFMAGYRERKVAMCFLDSYGRSIAWALLDARIILEGSELERYVKRI